MGWLDRLLGRSNPSVEQKTPAEPKEKKSYVVADLGENLDVTTVYTDRSITFQGYLKGYDYDKLQMNKQNYSNLIQLFKLSDYFTDSDEIIRGIIKETYVPFACADKWKLIGADETIKKRYEEYYNRIDQASFMESFFLQYFKYGNVYVYRMPSGRLMTQPVHQVRIEGLAVSGEPVIEFNCADVRNNLTDQYGKAALQQFIDDGSINNKLRGYPPEVADGVMQGMEWVQLNPANTYVSQDSKEEWVRYAVPFISACLKTLAKKSLISEYEDARLRLGAHGFVLATYGDTKHDVLPTREDLSAVANMMMKAITGSGLAVGNSWLEAKFVESDMRDLFEYDVYKNVNSALLDAGGISPIVVTGQAGAGSSFGTAQINVQTAALRIKQAKNDFARMMNKINLGLNGKAPKLPHAAPERIPEFAFPPTDLAGNKAFQETCLKLWDKGVLSHESLMQAFGMDVKQEYERRRQEVSDGYDEVFVAPTKRIVETGDSPAPTQETEPEEEAVRGRPTLDETERNSVEDNSVTGRAPKPSNPEGSEAQESG